MSRVERGYRFATIPEWVLYHPTLTSTAIRVYGCLDRHGQTPESCFPSYERIAKFCGISERSVPRPIAELAAVGAIEVVRRSVQEDEEGRPVIVLGDEGRQTSNGYRLAGDHPLNVAQESEAAHAQERTPRYAQERGSGYASERTEREKEEREPKEREENTLALGAEHARSATGSPPAESDEEFAEFYDAFPKHIGRGAARAVYGKARKKATRERILDGAKRYAKEVYGTPKRFIKAPAVWLNQECWDDEPGDNDRSDGKPTGAIGPRGKVAAHTRPEGEVTDL